MVTLLTITGVQPLGSAIALKTIAPPTVPELLHLLVAAYINLDHLAFVINMPPIYTFTPSNCAYGNTDPLSPNHKHRYVIIWKDGVERMLPTTLHTTQATFTLSASPEPGNNLPGFWTTELSTTKFKFYNGMMRALYTQYTTSGCTKSTGDHTIPGLRPSTRWYQYRQNAPTTLNHTALKQPSQLVGGGRRAQGPLTHPGRGHAAQPSRSLPNHINAPLTSSIPSPSTELTPRSSLTTAQQFEQILALCQTTVTETRSVRIELSNDRDTQARINADLRNSLAQAHAAIEALNSTIRK